MAAHGFFRARFLLYCFKRNSHISETVFTTPFAVHYEKIRIHLREMTTNSAKIHSLAPKNEHLRVIQIQ